jgi:type I restriction enzyme S subunit
MDNIIGMTFSAKVNLFITQKKFNDLKSYRISNGDIIISRAGTVGKMCVVESEYKDSIISTNLIRLKLDPDKLLPTYFVSLMNYAGGRVGRLKTGEDGAFTHMNTGILRKLMIPIPPITFQHKYLEVFGKINCLKQLTQQSLQKSEELFHSLLQRAFRGEL